MASRSRSPKRRRPLVDRHESHTNELPHLSSPSPSRPSSPSRSRSSAPKRNTALFSNSPRPSAKPLIFVDEDVSDVKDRAPASPPRRPLPIPPAGSQYHVPILRPDGWRHSQGSSTLIDSVSNYTQSPVLGAPDELDPAQDTGRPLSLYAGTKYGSGKSLATSLYKSDKHSTRESLTQAPTPKTPRQPYQYTSLYQYQSENNVPGLLRREATIGPPQWDESLRVAPLQSQSRLPESHELFETPSSGRLTHRNSLDELIADIARFHDGLSEAEFEYSSPVHHSSGNRFGTITSDSPISAKSGTPYPGSISSSSSNCFPRREYADSTASASPILAMDPDIDAPSRAAGQQRVARVAVPKAVLKQKEAQSSSSTVLEPFSSDPFTTHENELPQKHEAPVSPTEVQFAVIKSAPSYSSLYAESLYIPKKRTEKSSYQVAPLHTKDSQNSISASSSDGFGYATVVINPSPPLHPEEMNSEGLQEGTPSTIARLPRSALVPKRFASSSDEDGDDLAELRDIQPGRRPSATLRPSTSFDSGELSNEGPSSRPMSSRDSSGTESLPNWTRYDHKAIRRGPGLSSTSTFYLSQSSLALPSSPQVPQFEAASQDSTILSPEAARYAIFRERHFEQTSERAPEGSPQLDFQIPPFDHSLLEAPTTPTPAVAPPPVARLSSNARRPSTTSSGLAARSALSTSAARRKRRSRKHRMRKHHDAATWSPHLVVDRRSAVISPWQPPQPDLPAEHEGISMINVQIVMFCVGFVCPILWFIASFLPLPAKPAYSSSRKRAKGRLNEKDLEKGPATSRRNGELYWQEKHHDRARWWRNVNRVMSVVGIVLIIVFVVVAVITVNRA